MRLSRVLPNGGKVTTRLIAGQRHNIRRASTSTAIQQPDFENPSSIPQHPISHPIQKARRDAIKQAKPFSEFLTDNYHRQHDYLRISVTERCNLRCLYCMPEKGVPLSPQSHLLTSPEIFYLSSLFVSQGVTKVRLTGGEPTVRRDIVPLMHSIGSLRPRGLRELAITTNGISLHRKLDSMVEAGLTGVNLSLDTLDPFQFQIMTRRKGFDAVQKSIDRILEMNKLGASIKLKINCVVMRGLNEREILPFVELGREKDIEVRFIEYMPFDGNKWSQGKMVSYADMLDIIRTKYPGIQKVNGHKNDTSKTWEVPGFVGKFGFITSMTHNFCGTCNRLRITSDGNLKVCLFDGTTEVSLRDLLRKGNNNNPIDEEAFEAMKQIEMDRHQGRISSETALGWGERERKLLEIIGIAVKNKKEKHAGMGELENIKNRPMILIDKHIAALSNSPHLHSNLNFNPQTNSTIPSLSNRNPKIPSHLLPPHHHTLQQIRAFSTSTSTHKHKHKVSPTPQPPPSSSPPSSSQQSQPHLTHLTSTGSVHMVPIAPKPHTIRRAIAVGRVVFSNSNPVTLIKSNGMKKGDVLAVARVAGIMAAKMTPALVPLCHPIALTGVVVEVGVLETGENTGGEGEAKGGKGVKGEGKGQRYGSIDIMARVECTGPTGVEMEALTAVMGAALAVVDMCKAVDRGMRVQDVRVVRKEGGRSGGFREEGWEEQGVEG
ncbi:molybdenum cofactor biosynthesis prote [Patellaria atrata CBS 101060]|uniref:GTP 3',8-cyclase n=1 Tax=Patellaria atrata CBS 101060 TaxID=1346257 RepID=A0A9P4VVZ8_9PEZI|nr:molybdenum cofactor biosynthesis prote [Patellaria atrata CBS 101060]